MNMKSFFLWNGPKIVGVILGLFVAAVAEALVAAFLSGIFWVLGAPFLLTFKVLIILFGWGCISFTVKLVQRARVEKAEREHLEHESAEAARIDEIRFCKEK
jgi:hypothetical protein